MPLDDSPSFSPSAKKTGAVIALVAASALGATFFFGGKGGLRPDGGAPTQVAGASSLGASSSAPSAEPVTRLPAPALLLAIGDLHGDLEATRKVLRLAGAIDENDHWAGGDRVVVQTGDQLDRGDGERKILDLLDRLSNEAKEKGGALHVLNGNHEVMNVALDFRYVTEGGYKEFLDVPGANLADPRLAALPEKARPRAAAFLPGAPYAKLLARRKTILVVGDTVFVHGGVLPKHVRHGLERINRDVSAWMNGEIPSAPSIVTADDAPIWSRRFSDRTSESDCKVLAEVLAQIPAKRMVVGHTVQQGGISAACEDRVWRIDVGISHHYGGKPEALEIRGDAVKALRSP